MQIERSEDPASQECKNQNMNIKKNHIFGLQLSLTKNRNLPNLKMTSPDFCLKNLLNILHQYLALTSIP
jgi:hypothetical protein